MSKVKIVFKKRKDITCRGSFLSLFVTQKVTLALLFKFKFKKVILFNLRNLLLHYILDTSTLL